VTGLLLDGMYPPALAERLRAAGRDVVAVAVDRELVGCDDGAVLRHAAAADRCLVTENVRDFAVLGQYVEHAGILFVSARRWPRRPAMIGPLAIALGDAINTKSLPDPGGIGWL